MNNQYYGRTDPNLLLVGSMLGLITPEMLYYDDLMEKREWDIDHFPVDSKYTREEKIKMLSYNSAFKWREQEIKRVRDLINK